ncbi:MAG: hydantoinase/oxoprolinase family protein [Euryarchaeota archaeon]|nr:hydantoinase/oxoprolinase family protein [Euryarchaeota archaeon]
MHLGLGIDTGGTYTDAVIIDLEKGKVLSKAKALTTRHDLSEGIANAIGALDNVKYDAIRLVSVSSTLATNSVVEGKGCRVGLILAGAEYRQTVTINEVVEIKGGHNLIGERLAELEIDKAREFVMSTRNKVDAYAISSYLSVRNPEHEIALKKMVQEVCDLPVVCGNELSTKLGFYERTITAILNAKLIPIIADLLVSVKKVLSIHDIRAPLMIVKGDGSLMGEAMALEKPVETILSGPAASLIGAKYLTKEEDGIMIDIGGTTTDIGVLRGGKPRLDPEGAMIGGWRTRVKAADISTSGIGGDSRIVIANERIYLNPLRVMPLCIASSKWNCILPKLVKASQEKPRPQAGHVAIENVIQNTEFFIFNKAVQGMELSKEEQSFVDLIKAEPRTIYEVSEMTGIHPFSFNVRRLEEIGLILRIGLTPTDILHADGSYIEYDEEASKVAVQIQAGILERDPAQFCKDVRAAVIYKLCMELIKKLVYEETGKLPTCDVCQNTFDKTITHKAGLDYSVSLKLHKKIIGIGAPVGAYLPAVAERFETHLLLPEHSEVGNAVGAITGSIMETVEVLIRPKPGVSAMDNPPCTLHSSFEKREFETLDEAVAYAEKWVRTSAKELALQAGADEVELVVEKDDKIGHLGKSWGEGIRLETRVTATAIGKPRLFFEAKV